MKFNFRYAIEKIDKKYFFVKLFKKKRRIKIIRNSQQFTFVKISIRRSNLIKKFIRRFNRRFKITIFENENYEQNFDFDAFLNVFFIDATIFQSLVEFREKEKKIKTFSLIMKKLDEIIDNVKKNFIQVEFDFDFDFKKIFKIIKTIVEKLKRKVFDFFKRFEIVLNFKKIDKLFFYKFYDHKIELIENSTQLFRNQIYFLSFKKFETLQKYFHENFQKKIINSNKTFYVLFILFVVKSNDQFRLCVNYRKLNVIIKRNNYSISLIKKILVKIIDYKFLFKLNIISIFNKFRMNSQNENFIIFICSIDIYKYHVLTFELINDSIN